MGSGGVALAEIKTGEATPGEEGALCWTAGLEIARGNPQRAWGGGSGAGGTTPVFAGGVGVTEQLATFAGRP